MPLLDVYVRDQFVDRFALRHGATRIGRTARDNDLSFEHLGVDDLSARHLELTWDGAAVRARDLGSRNGTRLDGAPLVGEVALAEGSELRPGALVRLVLRVAGATEAERERDALAWAIDHLPALLGAAGREERLRVVAREAAAIPGVRSTCVARREAGRWRVVAREGPDRFRDERPPDAIPLGPDAALALAGEPLGDDARRRAEALCRVAAPILELLR